MLAVAAAFTSLVHAALTWLADHFSPQMRERQTPGLEPGACRSLVCPVGALRPGQRPSLAARYGYTSEPFSGSGAWLSPYPESNPSLVNTEPDDQRPT